MKRILSIAILAILILSILPVLALPIPKAAAQTVLSMKTSRDEWGKVWNNQSFYVDVVLSSKPGDKIPLVVEVGGNRYSADAIYITGTAYQYRAWFFVNSSGYLIWMNTTSTGDRVESQNRTLCKLSSGATITISYGSTSIKLTYKHTAASLKIRTEVPYPLNMTVTKDFYIVAPDLNKYPEKADWFLASVEVIDYTTGKTFGPKTFNFTESDANSGVFQVNTTQLYKDLGVDYSAAPGDYIVVKAFSIPKYQGASETEEATEEITVISSVAQITIEKATLAKLKILVVDPDENKDSTSKDSVDVYIKFVNGTTKKFSATETDDDTGNFTLTLYPYQWIASNGINYTTNKIEIYVTTGYYKASAGTWAQTNISKTVEIQYNKASISVEPTEILIPPSGTPIETIKIKITDADLNLDDEAKDVWTVTVPAKGLLEDRDLTRGGLVLGKLTVLAVKGDKEVALNASQAFTLTFVETDVNSGVFVAQLKLQYFDWNWIRSQLGGNPEKLVVKFEDLYTPDLEPKTVKAEVSVAKAKISIDRDYIPLSLQGNVVLHVTIEDKAAAGQGAVPVTVKVENYKGDDVTTRVIYGGVTSVTAQEEGVQTGIFKATITINASGVEPDLIGGKLIVSYGGAEKEIPFKLCGVEIYVNGTSKLEVKYGDVVNLTIVDPDRNLDPESKDSFTITVGSKSVELEETGANTGVFTATFKVDGTVGDPATTVKIEYKDKTPTYATSSMTEWPEAYTYTASLYIKSFTGELLVNGEEEKLEVGPAATLNITVVDPDANKDLSAKDTVPVYIRLWNGTFLPGWNPKSIEETDVSTGVFHDEFKITDLGRPSDYIGKEIQIIYRDAHSATGSVTTKIVTVKIVSWDPVIKTDKKFYNIGDRMKITVEDKDANTDPDTAQTITVRVYSSSDPIGTTVTLVETGPNTGVFTGEVLISNEIGSGRVYAKLGDTVTIEYTDQWPADYGVTGKSKTFTYTVMVGVPIEKPMEVAKFAAISPETGEAVKEFKVGERAGFTVTINNVAPTTETVTVIAVVQDPNGVTISVQAIKLPIAGSSSADVMFTFVPKLAGTYTVKIYVVKGLTPAERTIVLSPELEYTFTITVSE